MRVPHQLLRELVTVRPYEGEGSRGPDYGDQLEIRALMQPSNRLTTDLDGSTVMSDVVMIIRPEAGPVKVRSQVLWQSQGYRVVSGHFFPDTRRPNFYEAALVRLETS
jgi:hypothetical protein